MAVWPIFTEIQEPHDRVQELPSPPAWRYRASQLAAYQQAIDEPRPEGNAIRGKTYLSSSDECELVNAALFLRRPLLITGKPGTGKTSLAYAVAYQLKLGPVLVWPITTRTTLQDGLYRYDAIARLQAASLPDSATDAATDIGRYLRLGPLGTALLPSLRPRILLIDEIDKSDIDLPNDLLNIFEEGAFEIPELVRLPDGPSYDEISVGTAYEDGSTMRIRRGRVQCAAFPFVVLTSNGEREFPPAFLRRCLRLDIKMSDVGKLAQIVQLQLQPDAALQTKVANLIRTFVEQRKSGDMATDQLLNAVYLAMHNIDPLDRDRETLRSALLRPLSGAESL